ncbi:conserved hypothetical protein [Candidatus Roizmanbacteria bacterium]|nr:conserved hypothetical protein [Candidatus Roizmanbacteria bacterium]
MAQISKRSIDQKKLTRINELFFDLLLTMSDKQEVDEVLNELLTPTEKTMIAKRVACFYLLIKKVPIYEIEDTLKISTSTATYFKHYLDRSIVIKDYLSNKLKNEKLKHLFEDIFVDIFYGTLKKGSNWSEDKKRYYQHQRKRQQPFDR